MRQSKLLTTREAAEYYRVTPETVRNWIRTGKLMAINISNGRKPVWRIPKSGLSVSTASISNIEKFH